MHIGNQMKIVGLTFLAMSLVWLILG